MNTIISSELIVKQSEENYQKSIAEVSEKDPSKEKADALIKKYEIKTGDKNE